MTMAKSPASNSEVFNLIWTVFGMDNLWPVLVIYFQSFCHSTNLQDNVKNDPSSIWCQDSNSRPVQHNSPHLPTWRGLPPSMISMFVAILKNNVG